MPIGPILLTLAIGVIAGAFMGSHVAYHNGFNDGLKSLHNEEYVCKTVPQFTRKEEVQCRKVKKP